MPELADIFRTSAPEYMAKYGDRMLPSHKRAIDDIILCRTRPLGGKTYYCESCQQYRYSYHSCKNRNCTKCGNDDATRWLIAQSALLLPVPYFLVTVTLPAELRPVARSNQKCVYSLMFRSAAEAIQKLARDQEFVGGDPGIIAVLQTWRRDMGYHPHIHIVVTGGALSADGKRWLPAQRDYLLPEKALAKIFRAKFRDALKKTTLFGQVPDKVWCTNWVVDIESVGKGRSAIKYLTPYIFKVAISNKRIVAFTDGNVTFLYQDNRGRWHKKTLTAEKFMSRFLQHVLPKRFVKVRYYGFLSSRKRGMLDVIKELFKWPKTKGTESGAISTVEVRLITCPKCARPMLLVGEIKPERSRSP